MIISVACATQEVRAKTRGSLERFCTISRRRSTKQITPWSTVRLEKLIVTQLVKKFPACYGTRRRIAVFTRD